MSDNSGNKSWTCLSGFILKLIAFVTMTFDHVGVLLQVNVGENYWLGITFRIIGRIALPLICFLICEGMMHTKKPGNYLLRLGIMATIIGAAEFAIESSGMIEGMTFRPFGNIFMDLLLGALAVFLLKQKKWYLQIIAVIPFLIGFAGFIAFSLEADGSMLVHWFPYFLRPQYFFYGIGLIILFYIAHLFKGLYLRYYSNNSGIPVESLVDTQIERKAYNLIALGVLVIWTLVLYLVGYLIPYEWVFWDVLIQNAAIISGAFILLYNGKRGYNAKWFQYGSYFYYPLHILVIFGISLLF